MNELHQIVERYTVRYDKKIQNVTSLLKIHFNIFSYTYFKIDKLGGFVTLSNNPSQLDFYYSEQYYLNNPYLVDPDLLRSGSVLTATTQNKTYLDSINTSLNHFQMDNTFLMLERNEGQAEGFLFATKATTNQTTDVYLNNFENLKKFNRFFLVEMAPLLSKMSEDGFNMKQAKGTKFSVRNAGLPLAYADPISQDFLKKLSPLSSQEERCLDLFRRGNSAQATASIMGLSRRTVEHYFENIKNKLGCHSKWDLLLLG
ncbi:MAG: helix-turn-helix transcriptional regulator [Candidatus Protochlamydia sp.]|nr:helix-turn-helix transcriptional regulator [Candidatus Protochlamydia sp.]